MHDTPAYNFIEWIIQNKNIQEPLFESTLNFSSKSQWNASCYWNGEIFPTFSYTSEWFTKKSLAIEDLEINVLMNLSMNGNYLISEYIEYLGRNDRTKHSIFLKDLTEKIFTFQMERTRKMIPKILNQVYKQSTLKTIQSLNLMEQK